jgi:predicted XRE-type DNA-binding protein
VTKSAFHELEMPDADELVVKSRLIRLIADEIAGRQVRQRQAGELLALDQSNVSALVNGKISRFSVEKLMTFVQRLGFGVAIRIERGDTVLHVPFESAA